MVLQLMDNITSRLRDEMQRIYIIQRTMWPQMIEATQSFGETNYCIKEMPMNS
jgi:predicted O-methyltransferase YrrM